MRPILPRFARAGLLLLACAVAGCGQSELSEAEKWWLTPPPTADRIAFEAAGGKWGYRDRSGATVIAPRFDYAASFPGEGHVMVQGTRKTVHVRTPGKPMGRVEMNGKWGYIDDAGRILIAPRFDAAMDFFEDLTAVRVGDQWGYIDVGGRMILPPRYDEASPFLLGVAHVREGTTWRTIDRNGNDTADRE